MQDQNLYVQNNDDRTPPGLSGEKKKLEKKQNVNRELLRLQKSTFLLFLVSKSLISVVNFFKCVSFGIQNEVSF